MKPPLPHLLPITVMMTYRHRILPSSSPERDGVCLFAQCICVLMAPSSSPPQPTGKTVGDDLIWLIAGKQCEQPKARDKPGVTTAAKHCLMMLSSTEAYASLEDLLQSACVLLLHTWPLLQGQGFACSSNSSSSVQTVVESKPVLVPWICPQRDLEQWTQAAGQMTQDMETVAKSLCWEKNGGDEAWANILQNMDFIVAHSL